MRSFVNYYGGKWALARRYGPPQHQHVIEPFGGFAGYSTYWEPQQVTLIEKDQTVVATWRYLQRASPREILSIPTEIESVDELKVCQEAKWLVGWWFNRGLMEPAKQRSNWASNDKLRFSYWGQKIRSRIAGQLERIKHWKIIEGDYSKAPDIEAHWFIDAPYQRTGMHYRCNGIDYVKLAEWCMQRRGYVQVCESTEARWLQFSPFTLVKSHRARPFSAEAIYEFENCPIAMEVVNQCKPPLQIPGGLVGRRRERASIPYATSTPTNSRPVTPTSVGR